MPLHYCTFSLFPLLDHTFITVDCSPTAKAVWRNHGECNDLHSWFWKADYYWMRKDIQTRSHKAAQICKGSFGLSTSTVRGEKTHNIPRSEGCLQGRRSINVFIPRHYTHRVVYERPDNSKELWIRYQGWKKSFSRHSSSLPPYGDWGNYSQWKYHHMLRHELTKTYYSFTPQNGRSTHRQVCL